MLLISLLALGAVFALLLLARVGGARRAQWVQRWPAVLLAGAAIIVLVRGGIWPGLALAAAAVVAWTILPLQLSGNTRAPTAETPEDAAARAALGVGPTATHAEIRSAYRTKMAQAHPDRGGGHEQAARLTAARDRLLRKGKGPSGSP